MVGTLGVPLLCLLPKAVHHHLLPHPVIMLVLNLPLLIEHHRHANVLLHNVALFKDHLLSVCVSNVC